ncbi:MAG: ATP-binding protein [Chloroflexota bacterium]
MPREIVLAVTPDRAMRAALVQALSDVDAPLLAVEGWAQAVDTARECGIAVTVVDGSVAGKVNIPARLRLAVAHSAIVVLLHSDNLGDIQRLAPDAAALLPGSSPPALIRQTVERVLSQRRLACQARRLVDINRIGQQITSILDMNQLLWEASRLIQHTLALYHVEIALLDGDVLEIMAATGGEQAYLPPVGARHRLRDQNSLIARALGQKAPLLAAELDQSLLPPELCRARAALVMPIAQQEQLLGALEMLGSEPDTFETADLPLFEALAAQIAVAVQNARLFAGRRKYEETLHTLNQAAVSMQRVITSQAQVLEVMTNELTRSGFISLAHSWAPAAAATDLMSTSLSPRLVKALTDLLGTPPDDWRIDPHRAPIYRQAFEEKRAVFLAAVAPIIGQIVPGPLSPEQIEMTVQILGTPHTVVAPMLSGDQCLGWLTVLSPQLTADDTLPLTIFANQAAVALENARLLADARRADALALLNRAAQAMTTTLEFDRLLERLLHTAAATLKVRECAVALWDNAAQRYAPRLRWLGGQVTTVDADDGAASLPPLQIPLAVRSETLGLLALGQHVAGRELGPEEQQLARALANQAASALENARLYTELKQSAEELERSQRRLIQSGKLAATGRLAASIAHEINNPLQAIKNCLELILDETEAGESLDRTYLDVALNELERIRGIIQQMLHLYRPQQEQMSPVDLNDAVQGVLALMGKQLEKNHIALSLQLDASAPHAVGRSDQIRQVFINLILNAVEAMPQGGALTITTRRNSDDLVAVEVTDTGVGIAPENLSRIADPFFTTKPKGLGLGLTISHEIVERHQGTLDVTSQVGLGSTFTIRLPAAA